MPENARFQGVGAFGTLLAPFWSVDEMLKISIVELGTRRQLVLEGKLIAPWTDELTRICKGYQGQLQESELVVDIRGVTVISREGEDVLLALMRQGAKFRGRDVFTRQILRELARRAQKLAKLEMSATSGSD